MATWREMTRTSPSRPRDEPDVKALALIKESKELRYEGVIGPISFDRYGDVTGRCRHSFAPGQAARR